MKTGPAIWIVRPQAHRLAMELQAGLGGTFVPTSRSKSDRNEFTANFSRYRQWVLIMAAGIAARYLQGLPKNKKTDPGVVVLDEAARFAISFLGGHEGGANALAYRIAELTGATPVITTATETLKPLVLGIGCRKGVGIRQIDMAVKKALRQVRCEISNVREIATVDRKAMEPALRRWCEVKRLPLRAITAEVLRERSWTRKPSPWVRKNLGVDGVCEPCALIASPRSRLVLKKMAMNGVTVAVVSDDRSFQGKKL